MSQTIFVDSPERQSRIAQAAREGISLHALIDAHLAIALIVGKAYARALTEGGRDPNMDDGMARFVIEAIAYDGGPASETLTQALVGLPELGDLGGFDAVEEIARLLGHFARTTCSHPDGTTAEGWRNEIIAISTDLHIGLQVAGARPSTVAWLAQAATLERTMARLAGHFGHLWS